MNIDLHKVSLGALIISLGMLVDDAIVVVELMEVKMSEGWERTKAASYAFETCAMPLLDRYTDYLYRLYADIFRQIQCRRICFFTFSCYLNSTAAFLGHFSNCSACFGTRLDQA